jgi:hypothetical protein
VIGTKNPETITSVISSFTRQNEALLDVINQLLYYFRGSIGRDDAWALSFTEREMMISFLNKRFEEAGEMIKKKIPVFL